MNNKDFTFLELDHLIERGYLDKDKSHTFGINCISKSTNQGFGHWTLTKLENEEIHYSSSSPTNVDPDDGSYDTKLIERKYHNFNDFLNRKHYFEEEK